MSNSTSTSFQVTKTSPMLTSTFNDALNPFCSKCLNLSTRLSDENGIFQILIKLILKKKLWKIYEFSRKNVIQNMELDNFCVSKCGISPFSVTWNAESIHLLWPKNWNWSNFSDSQKGLNPRPPISVKKYISPIFRSEKMDLSYF